jgi:hypothetical protein
VGIVGDGYGLSVPADSDQMCEKGFGRKGSPVTNLWRSAFSLVYTESGEVCFDMLFHPEFK